MENCNNEGGPSPSTGARRKRSSRATNSQIDYLLTILEARPYLYTKKFTGFQARSNFETGWKELAKELNEIPYGSVKTPEQWQTVWRDLKSKTSIKAGKLRKQRAQTGNVEITEAPLTEVEKRVVSLIGEEYTFGTGCPDPMPEDDELQLQMEAGVAVPQIITIPQLHTFHVDVDVEAMQTSSTPSVISIQEVIGHSARHSGSSGGEQWPAPEIMNSDRAVADTSPSAVQEQLPSVTVRSGRAGRMSPPPTVQERPRSIRNLNPRRSVAEQHSLARQDFLTVAESNAQSMRMIATAMQMQAEALQSKVEIAKMKADTLFLKAQTESKVGDAILKLSEGVNKVGDGVLNLSQILSNRFI